MNTRALSVLLVRPFLFLWLAEIASQLAMNMINFVLIIVVFELTHSNTAVSAVVLAFTIPAILFGVLAGVMVDYWNKKKILLITNLARLSLLIGLAIFHGNINTVFFLTFAVSVATQFFIPAETPIIPLVVKKEELFAANAFFGIGVYGSALLAYALSGPLLLLFGKTNVFLILALFFGLAAVFVQGIVLPSTAHLQKSGKYHIWEGTKQAILLVVARKDIFHALFVLTLSQIIILILGVIGPSYSRTILHLGVEEFPLYFITPAALGMVVGAMILIRFFHNFPKVILANIGAFLSGGVIFILPYVRLIAGWVSHMSSSLHLPGILQADILHMAVILAFLLGFGNSLVFVPSNTLVQEETDDTERGKVYGVLNAVTGIVSLIPVILAGALTDLFGVFHVLQGIGVMILLIGIWRVMFLDVHQKVG